MNDTNTISDYVVGIVGSIFFLIPLQIVIPANDWVLRPIFDIPIIILISYYIVNLLELLKREN